MSAIICTYYKNKLLVLVLVHIKLVRDSRGACLAPDHNPQSNWAEEGSKVKAFNTVPPCGHKVFLESAEISIAGFLYFTLCISLFTWSLPALKYVRIGTINCAITLWIPRNTTNVCTRYFKTTWTKSTRSIYSLFH